MKQVVFLFFLIIGSAGNSNAQEELLSTEEIATIVKLGEKYSKDKNYFKKMPKKEIKAYE